MYFVSLTPNSNFVLIYLSDLATREKNEFD